MGLAAELVVVVLWNGSSPNLLAENGRGLGSRSKKAVLYVKEHVVCNRQ